MRGLVWGAVVMSVASEASTAPRLVVRVIVAGDDDHATALDKSLREMLSHLAVVVETRRAERVELDDAAALAVPSDALATAWVDLLPSAHATLVLVDGAGHVIERRIVPSDGSLEIAVEAVAEIVYASVEDIAPQKEPPAITTQTESLAAPLEVEPVVTPEVHDAVQARATGSVRVAAGGFVSSTTVSGSAPVILAGGIDVGASYTRSSLRPTLRASVSVAIPFEVAGPLLAVDVYAMSARLTPTVRLFGGRTWFIEAGAEGGADVFWVTPRSTGLPRRFIDGETTNASPIVGALVGGRFALGPRADFVFALAADVDLAPHRYVIHDGASTDVAFEPWLVRPTLVLGLDFTLAGAPR